jgi:hypothetical protein
MSQFGDIPAALAYKKAAGNLPGRLPEIHLKAHLCGNKT